MKYVLYHSSLTGDRSTMQRLKDHARNGEIVAEYFDDLSKKDHTPELNKALEKCKETGAMLLILDLSVVNNAEASEKDGVQIKRIA